MDFISILSIFVLACFVGYYVVWSVTPALHTPLMAVTNAISSVIVVGALVASAAGAGLSSWLGLGAVVVGVGTVNADNPLLTVRHVAGRNPVRVVLDPRGRARAEANLFHDGAAPTVHLLGEDLAPACARLPDRLVRVGLPRTESGFAPAAVLEGLAGAGCRRVLVEGGGLTVSRFVQAGAIDRLHLLVAPLLIGSGRPGLVLPPIDALDEALRPVCRQFRCGGDTLFDLDFDGAHGRFQQVKSRENRTVTTKHFNLDKRKL